MAVLQKRKNQKDLSADERAAFIAAINALHGLNVPTPSYMDFISVHAEAMNHNDPTAMAWGVHTMGPMMPGRNFLPWHRQFVLQLEKRLQATAPAGATAVTVPYWDWMTDQSIPAWLDAPQLLGSWG